MTQPTQSTATNETTEKQTGYSVSPFYAFLLALLHPGIGMAYATSQWRTGFLIVLTYHGGKLTGLLLYVRTAWFPVLASVYGVLAAVSVGFGLKAIQEAKVIKPRKQTFTKVLAVVGFSILLSYLVPTRWITHVYRVQSHSMAPTIVSGDYLMVSKLAYGFWNPFASKQVLFNSKPQRGQVVVFLYPKDPRKAYIKRIVGVPGDTIALKQGLLYVNGKPTPRMYQKSYRYKAWNAKEKRWSVRDTLAFNETLGGITYTTLHDQDGLPHWRNWSSSKNAPQMTPPWGPTIPKGYVFVLGDNRDRSSDSRDWGIVKQEKIVGKVLHILLSRRQHFRWKRTGKAIQ